MVRPPRLQMGMRGERKRSSSGGRCTALRSPESGVSASVQPNPNSERGNVALYVVRGQRGPAKWNCAVTQCGGVVGTATERFDLTVE